MSCVPQVRHEADVRVPVVLEAHPKVALDAPHELHALLAILHMPDLEYSAHSSCVSKVSVLNVATQCSEYSLPHIKAPEARLLRKLSWLFDKNGLPATQD